MPFRRLGPALFFAALALVFFFPFWAKGWVLDGNSDLRNSILPLTLFYLRAFKAARIPQWNPYIFCGTSAFNCAGYPFFYPLDWPAFLLPEERFTAAYTAILLVHVGLAALFAGLLFRRLKADRFWSVVGALMYVLSSSSALMMASGWNLPSFVYLPAALWLIASYELLGPVKSLLAQAPVYALLILGGHIQQILYALAFCVTFAFWRSLRRGPRGLILSARELGTHAGGLLAAILITSPKWVPFYLATRTSGNFFVSYDVFLREGRTRPSDFMRFLVPEFFGDSSFRNFFGSINHFETASCYVGVFGGVFALISLLTAWEPRNFYWKALICLLLLGILGHPIIYFHYLATGRAQLLYNRMAWLLPLCCAALVALNGEDLLVKNAARTLKLSAALLALAGVLLAYAYFMVLPEEARTVNAGLLARSIAHFVLFSAILLPILALARVNRARASGAARVLFLLGLAADLLITARIEGGDSYPLFSPPPLIRFSPAESEAAARLKEQMLGRTYRIFKDIPRAGERIYDRETINNRYIAAGLYDPSGYDNNVSPLLSRLYSHGKPVARGEARCIYPRDQRAAELTSTAYVIRDDTLIFYRGALPRAKLFTRYEVIGGDAALKRVLAPDFDPPKSLVLDAAPPIRVAARAEPGSAEISSDTGEEVAVDVRAKANALLLLTDTYARGWTASIDGAAAPILRANYAFRAVAVPSGTHRVVWSYSHPGLAASLRVAAAALAGYAALMAFAFRRGFRPTPRPNES